MLLNLLWMYNVFEMRRLLEVVIFFIISFILVGQGFAQNIEESVPVAVQDAFKNVVKNESLKITSVVPDVSNSLIYITTSGNMQQSVAKEIKLVKLQNPNRAYFDIESAVLTLPKQDFQFSKGNITGVKVAQFSTEPDVVRVVMYFEDSFDSSKIKILQVGSNFVILSGKPKLKEDYMMPIYRSTRVSESDYYEYNAISLYNPNVVTLVSSSDNNSGNKVLTQINQAFHKDTEKQAVLNEENNYEKIDTILNTKYYVSSISAKGNDLLISGVGSLAVLPPMVLEEPNRLVYDIPNAMVNPAFRNKEIKLGVDATARIGQFEVNTARVVIDTNQSYMPVYSPDNQSLLLVNTATFNPKTMITQTTDAISYHYSKPDSKNSDFVIAFSKPIVYSIRQSQEGLNVYFFNAMRYNEAVFSNTIKSGIFSDMKISMMPEIGLRLTLPLEAKDKVSCFLGADGKAFQIRLQNYENKSSGSVISKIVPIIKNPSKKSAQTVVIDPGHGGADCGAYRENIYEKDITLDVSKRIANILKQKGYHVIMTRTDDSTQSLQERVDVSENSKADVFVSVHVNSSVKPEILGVETHYYHDYSLKFAQYVHTAFSKEVKSPDRGLFKSKFYVINHTTCPAILVEIGFISNEEERAELVNEKRKQQTAKSIAEGIIEYLKQQ